MKIHTTIFFEPDVYVFLKKKAQKQRKSLSAVVRYYLEKGIKDEENELEGKKGDER